MSGFRGGEYRSDVATVRGGTRLSLSRRYAIVGAAAIGFLEEWQGCPKG